MESKPTTAGPSPEIHNAALASIGTDGGHYTRPRETFKATVSLPGLSLEQQLWNLRIEAQKLEKKRAKQQRDLVQKLFKGGKNAR